MKVFIVTGSSRGLGFEICKQLIRSDHLIFAIARSNIDALTQLAEQNECTIHFVEYDLQNLEGIPGLMERILQLIPPTKLESITLINNAAQVTPLGPIDCFTAEETVQNIQLNLLSPILLTQSLLQQTKRRDVQRIIVNISSGSAKQSAAGMSLYCASKAALNMFTSCVQLENHKGLTTYTIDPGMMDTDMQAAARNEDRLPVVSFFREAKETGALKTAQDVARKIVSKL